MSPGGPAVLRNLSRTTCCLEIPVPDRTFTIFCYAALCCKTVFFATVGRGGEACNLKLLIIVGWCTCLYLCMLCKCKYIQASMNQFSRLLKSKTSCIIRITLKNWESIYILGDILWRGMFYFKGTDSRESRYHSKAIFNVCGVFFVNCEISL